MNGLAWQAGDSGDVADATRVGAFAYDGRQRREGVQGVLDGLGEGVAVEAGVGAWRAAEGTWGDSHQLG